VADYPPLEQPVIVTMHDGTEFVAVRIIVRGETEDYAVWATSDEYEPNCPECWDDGVCWGSNSNGQPSRKPVAWRPVQ
jgi:hypothetical protein